MCSSDLVVLIPVLNRENRILQLNEDNFTFGTVFFVSLLGVLTFKVDDD